MNFKNSQDLCIFMNFLGDCNWRKGSFKVAVSVVLFAWLAQNTFLCLKLSTLAQRKEGTAAVSLIFNQADNNSLIFNQSGNSLIFNQADNN